MRKALTLGEDRPSVPHPDPELVRWTRPGPQRESGTCRGTPALLSLSLNTCYHDQAGSL